MTWPVQTLGERALGRGKVHPGEAGGRGWPLISLATPYHMPIFDANDALALVRSPHLRGLAAAQGDFHDLWPRTAARDLTTMGFLRHWGDVVFVNTLHPNRAQRTVKLSSSSPQVWLCSVGVNEGSSQASRPSGPAEHACIFRPYYHIGHRNER